MNRPFLYLFAAMASAIPQPASAEMGGGHTGQPVQEEEEVDLSKALLDDPIVGSRWSSATTGDREPEEHAHFHLHDG